MKLETEGSADGARTFEFTTKSLGRITCAPMKVRQHIALRAAIAKEHKGAYPDTRQFTSYLLSVLGKRADAPGSTVSLKEAEGLEDGELEQFAAAFLENNQWLSSNLGSPKADEESHQAYLLRAFKAFEEKREKSFESFAWMSKPALRTLEMFKRNEPLYQAIAAAKKAVPRDMFSNATLEMLKRNASISKTLAGSIGQIRAVEEATRRLGAVPVEAERRPLEFKLPPNPVHDTNRLLAEVRDVMVQAADLIKSLNDTTIGMARDSARYSERIILGSARYSRWMISVGVVSVIIALVAAFLNWKGLQNANRAAALFHKAVHAQGQSIARPPKAVTTSRNVAPSAQGSTPPRATQGAPLSATAHRSAEPAHP